MAASVRRGAVLATAVISLACLLQGRQMPLVVFNATASAPIGFYRVLRAGSVETGDLVLARTPDRVRDLAARRGYIPASVPLVKRVVALNGAEVCADGRTVAIDGRPVARRRAVDGQGRTMPVWIGCRRLAVGEFFLLMADVPDSFDSRYFGPITEDAVIGRLVPLWLH